MVTLRRRPPDNGPASSRLSDLDRAVAVLRDGETLVGHLATKVEVWWIQKGRWWKRRFEDPQECLAWVLTFANPEEWEEGLIWGVEVDRFLAERDERRFDLRGRTFTAQWIDGDERLQAWDTYGWIDAV